MSKDDEREDPGFKASATLMGILSRVKAGDYGAGDPELRERIDRAFSKHHVKLRQFVARELRNFSEQQVEETVQDVLLTAWRQLPGHDGRDFKAWLYRIAANACANVRRKARDVLSEDGLFDPGSDGETAYARLRREERERLFLEASARVLSPQDQEVVYMRYELELAAEEIARLAGLKDTDEVRVVLQRCKRRLSKELEAMLSAMDQGPSLFRDDG